MQNLIIKDASKLVFQTQWIDRLVWVLGFLTAGGVVAVSTWILLHPVSVPNKTLSPGSVELVAILLFGPVLICWTWAFVPYRLELFLAQRVYKLRRGLFPFYWRHSGTFDNIKEVTVERWRTRSRPDRFAVMIVWKTAFMSTVKCDLLPYKEEAEQSMWDLSQALNVPPAASISDSNKWRHR